jgi:16S rRNA (guanine(966)-N(2))-methyltransferase RsmD
VKGAQITPNAKNIRPTSDKAASALFNILRSGGLLGADFLDLFAGTGRVAARAAALGAGSVLCVESDMRAVKAITAMFQRSGFADRASCIASDVRRAVPRLAAGGRSFGVVFADPPYLLGWAETLPLLIEEHWSIVAPGGVFAFERSSRETPADISVPRDDRIYGKTVISFYWKPESGEN